MLSAETPRPRWFTDTKDGHSAWYVARFRQLAAEGADLAGEARFVDALLPRGSRVLDAGCGPGRLGAELHARGHAVVGVDADAELIAAAQADHPGPRWLVADLSGLDLGPDDLGHDGKLFDLAVLAGNVMLFVAPGSEQQVLTRVAAHVRPGGRVITGFATDRDYRVAAFDHDCAGAGLLLEHRFATWDLEPWHDDAEWAVSVLRRPA
jgi:2-polyprenyl-3-methyl-5-hydroxy-6-metoxy-1,4-benzoquinol methylase